MLVLVLAVATVLVISFLCSIYESVLLSISRPQVQTLVQQGKRAGVLLEQYKSNMDVPISAILILNTAAHTIGAAAAGASYVDVFGATTLWVFSLLFTFAVLLFTEIIPKTLGVSYASRLAVPVAYGIQMLTIVLRPLVAVSEMLSRMLRPKQEVPATSSEEIRMMALLGLSEDSVSRPTARIVTGATQLRHLKANDIMLPREEVAFLSAEMDRETILQIARETRHSRFPFSPTDELDDVSGVVHVKELFLWMLANPDSPVDWSAFCSEPLVVPEATPLKGLLREIQNSRRHLAIVVDEYGSVSGIATFEDLLEEIIGDIRDESDEPDSDIVKQSDGSMLARGHVDLRRLSAQVGVLWDPEADVAVTISGLFTNELNRIPVAGDTIDWKNFKLEVLEADNKKALWVSVRSKP